MLVQIMEILIFDSKIQQSLSRSRWTFWPEVQINITLLSRSIPHERSVTIAHITNVMFTLQEETLEKSME